MIRANAVMVGRLNHARSDNTPSKMVKFKNLANKAVKIIAKFSDADAKKIEVKEHKRWTF